MRSGYWFLAGLGLGAVAVGAAGARQYALLRAFADSTARSSAKAESQAQRFKDSIFAVIRSDTGRTRIRTVYVEKTDRRVDSLAKELAIVKTASDTILNMRMQIASLQLENDTLKVQHGVDSLNLFRATIAVDSLWKTNHTLNESVQTLTRKIDALRGLPKWAKISFEVAKIGLASYAGYRCGKTHCI